MAYILIFDDENTIRGLLRSALQTVGHEVSEAVNGRQELELYGRQTWSSQTFSCPS